MEFEIVRSESDVLSETDIDFYGNPEVQFHFNSGRTFESEEIEEEQDDGTIVKKERIDTTPCPTIDVYENSDSLDVLIHLPTRDPVIINHLRVTEGYEEFFAEFVEMLEDGYNGIEEVTQFDDDSDDSDLGEMLRTALREGTPDSVTFRDEDE